MYTILRLRVDDGHGDSLEQSKRHETLLLVTEAIILVGERKTIEYLFGVHEVEAVIFQVPFALRLVPRKSHELVYSHYVYTSSGATTAV